MIADVTSLLDVDIPVLLWGAPGTGKTAAITRLAKERGVHLEVLIGSTMDPTDLGRPYMKKDSVEVAPPPWAKRLHTALNSNQEAWLFLDELTCAPPAIQAALLRVVNERKVVDLDLSGVKIIGAANPPEYAADPTDLSAATSNRWCHLEWNLEAEDWIAGELTGWGAPPLQHSAAARTLVTGWIGLSPNALLAPPAETAENVKGWPSPRSWSAVTRFLSYKGIDAIKTREAKAVVSGLIGVGACTEFTAWVADQDIPDGKDLLDGKATLPSRGDRVMIALNSATAHALMTSRMEDLFKLFVKARKDVALMSMRRAVRSALKGGVTIPNTVERQTLLDGVTGADRI